MKCIILAGGTGDSLWPLSRKNYPKQFMNIKEGRSMLQETVVRNMPFCDEFIIVTRNSYKDIVDGQMKVFQSLKYRVVLEGEPRGTAAAVLLSTFFFNYSEFVYVLTADHIIDGNNYKDSILKCKEYAKDGCVVALGATPDKYKEGHDYIMMDKDDVIGFIKNRHSQNKKELPELNEYLWNTGMYIFRIGDFINTVKNNNIDMFNICRAAAKRVPALSRSVLFSKEIMQDIPSCSIEDLLYSKLHKMKVVKCDFSWRDIGSVDDIEDLKSLTHDDCVIENNCEDVAVINSSDKQLVVTNDIKDIVVVNTEDAVYVSSKEKAEDIKSIIRQNEGNYSYYFDYNKLSYREWGMSELLNSSADYRVKKVTVYPGMSMQLHQHELRSEHWSIVEGMATITLGDETKDYNKFESVFVPVGMQHKVSNKTDKNVVIIEVAIGDKLIENDMVKIYNNGDGNSAYPLEQINPIVKLEPAFKDNLWGGTKLRTIFGKKCDYDIIAESWELSAHPDGQSRVASGKYKGMLFNDYLELLGKGVLGWKCQAQDRFPILIKFIDAKQALSIQIHPDDEYGLENEGEYGKNEMWYVVDCEPGSYLYCGLSKKVDKAEIEQRIKDNTITDILNKIEVKKGDVVMVKAGTIHAIGAGIIICEIQQNSNSTYRMYDYDRRDKYGNPRELHVAKALDVVDTTVYEKDDSCEVEIENNEHYNVERLVQCKYFECFKYVINDEAKFFMNESSFASVVFIEGEGTICTDDYEEGLEFKAGDSFFINSARRVVQIKGRATCIVTHV